MTFQRFESSETLKIVLNSKIFLDQTMLTPRTCMPCWPPGTLTYSPLLSFRIVRRRKELSELGARLEETDVSTHRRSTMGLALFSMSTSFSTTTFWFANNSLDTIALSGYQIDTVEQVCRLHSPPDRSGPEGFARVGEYLSSIQELFQVVQARETGF
jgi:hypothetical protein